MGKKEISPEQEKQERLRKAKSTADAISHFNIKLGAVKNESPIEEQIKYLLKYNDIPSVEEVKANKNKLDSYRLDFMKTLYDKYFTDYPEILEKLGDKKTDNNMANFAMLDVMHFLFQPTETKETDRKENIKPYFTDILPKYQEFLINYIVNNQAWSLTINSKEAFLLYQEICEQHKQILAKYPSPTDIALLIRDVRNNLVDKIAQLKQLDIDDDTYARLVTDVVIGKYKALKFILNEMAGGGPDVLNTFISLITKEYPFSEIYIFSSEVQDKLVLDNEQKEYMNEITQILEGLYQKGFGNSSNGSGSGCMLVFLLLIVPMSLLLFL